MSSCTKVLLSIHIAFATVLESHSSLGLSPLICGVCAHGWPLDSPRRRPGPGVQVRSGPSAFPAHRDHTVAHANSFDHAHRSNTRSKIFQKKTRGSAVVEDVCCEAHIPRSLVINCSSGGNMLDRQGCCQFYCEAARTISSGKASEGRRHTEFYQWDFVFASFGAPTQHTSGTSRGLYAGAYASSGCEGGYIARVPCEAPSSHSGSQGRAFHQAFEQAFELSRRGLRLCLCWLDQNRDPSFDLIFL